MTDEAPTHPAVAIAEATAQLREADDRIETEAIRFAEAMKTHHGWLTSTTRPNPASNAVRKRAVQTLAQVPANLLMATCMLLTVLCPKKESDRLTKLLRDGPGTGPAAFTRALAEFVRDNAGSLENTLRVSGSPPTGHNVH